MSSIGKRTHSLIIKVFEYLEGVRWQIRGFQYSYFHLKASVLALVTNAPVASFEVTYRLPVFVSERPSAKYLHPNSGSVPGASTWDDDRISVPSTGACPTKGTKCVPLFVTGQ